jgi:predicted nucleic acid-binding protein
MGSLNLPNAGTIYLDVQIIVYSIEVHPRYAAALNPVWDAADEGRLVVATSQLSILEAIVGPLKHGLAELKNRYDALFAGQQLYTLPIHESILRRAAELRAAHSHLPTPDAIHVATPEHVHADLLLTNDKRMKNIPSMPIQLLDEIA